MQRTVLCFVALFMALGVWAQNKEYEYNSYKYRILDETTAEVCGGGTSGASAIPSKISLPPYDRNAKEYTVVKIADGAFRNLNCGATEIAIPSTVTEIGKSAFERAYVDKIELPGSVQKIGQSAFVFSHISEIVLPSGLTAIPERFLYGAGVKRINIPSSIKTVGDKAFADCPNLATVDIADLRAWCGIEFLGEHSNPISVGHDVELHLNDKLVTELAVPDGITEVKTKLFSNYSHLVSVSFPAGVKTIGSAAFNECRALKEVRFADGLESIGNSAFGGCKLSACSFPASLKTIGDWAFSSNKLVELVFPDALESIGEMAFYLNTSLVKVCFGRGLISCNMRAFSGCSHIDHVECPDLESWCKIDFETWQPESNPTYYSNTLYIGGEMLDNLVVPESVTELNASAFRYVKLSSVTLHSGVTDAGSFLYGFDRITSYAAVPPAVADEFNQYSYRNALVTVPSESLDAYKADSMWSGFLNWATVAGLELRPTDVWSSDEEVEAFSTSGVRVFSGRPGNMKLAPGLYIVKSTAGVFKHVVTK